MTSLPVPHPSAHASPRLAARVFPWFVALHGLAHFVGTRNTFTLARDGDATHYLADNWVVDDPTTLRVFGVLWAVLGLAFLATALAIAARRRHARVLLLGVAAASLVLSLVCLWAAVVGAVIDVALLVVAGREPSAVGLDR